MVLTFPLENQILSSLTCLESRDHEHPYIANGDFSSEIINMELIKISSLSNLKVSQINNVETKILSAKDLIMLRL